MSKSNSVLARVRDMIDSLSVNKKIAAIVEDPNWIKADYEDENTIDIQHKEWFQKVEKDNVFFLQMGEVGTETSANSNLKKDGLYQIHFGTEMITDELLCDQPFAPQTSKDRNHCNVKISGFLPKATDHILTSAPVSLTDVKYKLSVGTPIHAVLIRYRYPLQCFPYNLTEEIRQLESFFGELRRGEGNDVYLGSQTYLLSYRVFNRTDEIAIGFAKTLKEIMLRYGVDVMTHESWRVR